MLASPYDYTLVWQDIALQAGLSAAVRRVLTEAGEKGVDVAQANARVDTGAMRDSVRYDIVDVSPMQSSLIISAGNNLPDARALYNELGTSNLPAQPFVRPGADAAIAEIQAKLGAKG
jgi:HK97 gp10 family phage protein